MSKENGRGKEMAGKRVCKICQKDRLERIAWHALRKRGFKKGHNEEVVRKRGKRK
jgi:hypothetical protein